MDQQQVNHLQCLQITISRATGKESKFFFDHSSCHIGRLDGSRDTGWDVMSLCSGKLSFSSVFVNSLVVASWRRRWGGAMWLSTGSLWEWSWSQSSCYDPHGFIQLWINQVCVRWSGPNRGTVLCYRVAEASADVLSVEACAVCAPWRSRQLAKKVSSSAEFHWVWLRKVKDRSMVTPR